MDSLKLGVIGCGNMGISLAQGASVLNCANVICVSDVDEKKGQDLAGQMNCDFEPDYRALLSRQDVDAVLIATPPFLHEEPAIAAAEAGIHIFCEKPMAPTLKGCDAIQHAVTKHKVKLGLGLVCRFHPVHRKVRELAHSGDLGTPTCMTVHRLGGGWGGQWTAAWRQTRAQSGGTLMEVNAHEIDFLRAVMGDVVQVYATGGSYTRTDADFPDIVLVNLTFKSGATGLLHSSMASTIGSYGGRLDCTEGTVAFPTFWGKDGGLRYKRHDTEETFLPAEGLSTEESPVSQEIRAFAEAVLADKNPPVTGADGRAATEIALAAYRSVETGVPVSLPYQE